MKATNSSQMWGEKKYPKDLSLAPKQQDEEQSLKYNI